MTIMTTTTTATPTNKWGEHTTNCELMTNIMCLSSASYFCADILFSVHVVVFALEIFQLFSFHFLRSATDYLKWARCKKNYTVRLFVTLTATPTGPVSFARNMKISWESKCQPKNVCHSFWLGFVWNNRISFIFAQMPRIFIYFALIKCLQWFDCFRRAVFCCCSFLSSFVWIKSNLFGWSVFNYGLIEVN